MLFLKFHLGYVYSSLQEHYEVSIKIIDYYAKFGSKLKIDPHITQKKF